VEKVFHIYKLSIVSPSHMDHHHFVNCKEDYSWKKRDYSGSSVLEFGSHEYSADHLGHGKIVSLIYIYIFKKNKDYYIEMVG